MTQAFESLRVLVVDDDELQRELMLVHLFRLGIKNCTAARDGQEALELLHDGTRTFDVVLTDNQMPGIDGPDLIRAIRNTTHFAHLKVAMISGNLSNSEHKRPSEQTLRSFLTEHNVLGVPKDGLTRTIIESILHQLLRE